MIAFKHFLHGRLLSTTPLAVGVSFLLLLSSNLVRTTLAQTASSSITAVDFYVVDLFGSPLPYRVATFAPIPKTSITLTDRFRVLHGEMIPYGKYSYQLRRTDFPAIGPIDGNIVVSHQQVWLTVLYSGSPVIVVDGHPSEGSYSYPKDFTITGIIRPQPTKGSPNWVRLVSLYAEETEEAPIDENGVFRVHRYLRGDYVLFVFQDGKLADIIPLTFRLGRTQMMPLVIQLSGVRTGPILVQ